MYMHNGEEAHCYVVQYKQIDREQKQMFCKQLTKLWLQSVVDSSATSLLKIAYIISICMWTMSTPFTVSH